MFTKPVTPVESVLTAQEVADWLSIDNDDPLISGLSIAATSAAIEYLQLELISRERVVIYEEWPYSGTDTSPSLSRNNVVYDGLITLPYANIITVDLVKLFGVVAIEYQIKANTPTQLKFTQPVMITHSYPAVEVEYTAGYGDIDSVPEQIKTAVKMIVAYMYENRGGCAGDDALRKSGAAVLLNPFKAYAVVL